VDVVSDASGRLVVIDDEAPILRYTHELLKSSGFEVRAFTNPLEAFVYLEANLEQVDLVIADRSMPGMTGMDLVQKLAILRPSLPILLSTGYSDRVDQQLLKAFSHIKLLTKPHPPQLLLRTLHGLLKNTQALREPDIDSDMLSGGDGVNMALAAYTRADDL
jgi:CheY-like chemotaxis protein